MYDIGKKGGKWVQQLLDFLDAMKINKINTAIKLKNWAEKLIKYTYRVSYFTILTRSASLSNCSLKINKSDFNE